MNNLITEKNWSTKNIRIVFVLFVLMAIAFFFSFASYSYAITITGTGTITTNSSASYSVGGCEGSVSWSVTGTGASISSNGVLTTGSVSCGGITVTARCSDGSIATKTVRVTNAGQWVLVTNTLYCSISFQRCTVETISGNTKEVFQYARGFLTQSPPNCTVYGGGTCPPAGKPSCFADDCYYGNCCFYLELFSKYEWQCPPCTNSQTISCYTGAGGTQGVGVCKAGTQTCTNGQWGVCVGEVLPTTEEVCGDNLDNNCNGQIDEGCCEVGVKVSPTEVAPQKTSGNTQADVVVTLNKPAPPEGCTVRLKVEPIEESGGHNHDGSRNAHVGTLGKYTVVLKEIGPNSIRYTSSEIAGEEKIKIKVNDKDTGETTIDVMVPGLGSLSTGANYELIGTPDNHRGTNDPCRWSPPTSLHYKNHYGTGNLVKAVKNIADDYAFYYPGTKLRINDMSLLWGGLFDVGNNWSSVPGHSGHRVGKNADIGYTGIDSSGKCTSLKLQGLYRIIKDTTGIKPYIHGDHYHIYVY